MLRWLRSFLAFRVGSERRRRPRISEALLDELEQIRFFRLVPVNQRDAVRSEIQANDYLLIRQIGSFCLQTLRTSQKVGLPSSSKSFVHTFSVKVLRS